MGSTADEFFLVAHCAYTVLKLKEPCRITLNIEAELATAMYLSFNTTQFKEIGPVLKKCGKDVNYIEINGETRRNSKLWRKKAKLSKKELSKLFPKLVKEVSGIKHLTLVISP